MPLKSLTLLHLVVIAVLQFACCALAAPPAGWEVIRIFVREDEVGSLVPQDYSPVEIEDLTAALKREEERRSQALLDSPRLADAIYVAQCTLDQLNSNQSRWQIASQLPDASMTLGDLSCALKSATVVPGDDQSLIRNLRFSVDGQSTVSGINSESTYWFGFSSSPTKLNSQQSTFDIRLPPATLGRMLISAPNTLQLTSPDVVVSKVADPRTYLPQDWPTLPTVEHGNWYVLHVSGRASFRVIAESMERKDAFTFQQFIRSANLTYDVSSSGLSVAGEFALERLGNDQPIEIRISQALLVKSITVGGQPIDWQIDSSVDPASQVIALVSDKRTENDCVIQIECVSAMEYPFTGALPTLAVEQGFAWSGTTNLLVDHDFIVEEVHESSPTARIGSWRLVPAAATVAATSLSTDDAGSPVLPSEDVPEPRKVWTTSWTGVSPKTTASISRVDYPWKASSFTRIMLQPNWIAVAAHLQLSAKQLKSNELRLRLGEGWLIDGLTIEQSTLPVNYQLPDVETGDIVLNWDRLTQEMTIKLRLAAHLSQNTEVDRLTFQAPRVVSLPGAEQEDVYAIEQAGRFRTQSDPLNQRLLLRHTDLAAWQSQLVTQPDTLLLRGAQAAIPALMFKRSSGTYTTSLQTVATPEVGQLRVEYSLAVEPVSGAIDRVTCLLNLPSGAIAPTWSLVRDDDRLPLPATQSVAATIGVDLDTTPVELDTAVGMGETLYEILLPESTAEKFILLSEIVLPINAMHNATLPLLSTTGAVSTDAILALPRRFSLRNSSAGIEALPSSICCSSGELSTLLGSLGSSMVAYRYDPASVSTVDLQTLDSDSNVRAWAWSDQTDHWLFNDGRVSHRSDWQIFAPESGECSIELPVGWMLDRLLLDGEPIEISRQTQTQKIGITLPRSERIQLMLYASSYSDSLSWLSQINLARPSISLGSLHSTELLWLQPSKLALEDLRNTSSPSSPASLFPRLWWHWLTPDFDYGKTSAQGLAGREDLPPRPQRWRAVQLTARTEKLDSSSMPTQASASASGVYVIDRAALSGVCMAILLAGTGIAMLLLGKRAWAWWLSMTLTLATITLVPSFYSLAAHMLLLCLVCGAVVRLMCVVVHSRTLTNSQVSQRGSTLQRRAATIAMWLIWLPSGTMVQGQVASLEEVPPIEPSVFGVIIPLNKHGELSAKHVYAPRKLMNLLENPGVDDSLSQPPEILGAKYMLKLRGGTSLTTSYVQEFTAEFEVQFDSSAAELQLPFSAGEVQLLRGFVFGQEVYIGSRLKQTPNSITYYPDEPGRVRIRLQLIPKQFETDDRTALEVTIPKIATATLEVLTDDFLDVKVVGKGEVRRASITSLEADIGPVSSLKLNWPTRPQRTPTANQSQIFADTWLQIQGRQVMADCQLRMEGAAALPKQLHLIVDAGWEPVGTRWQDVQLLASELSMIGNRRIYTVTRAVQSDVTIARVLLVPRNAESTTTVNVPFLSLQENSLASRTLAIATTKSPGWKLTGTDLWNRLPTIPAELQWDSSKFAQQPTILRVPNGALSATLQRSSEPAPALVAESNIVTFMTFETSISYRAVWPQINSDRPVLMLRMPASSKVKNVQVNGMSADHQIVNRDSAQLLVVNVDNAQGLQQLDVKLSLGTHIGKSAWLPRIVLEDTPVISSDFQVRCGAELTCRISEAQDSGLVLSKPATSPTEMLSNMASGIGRVELGSSFRESPQLPMRFELARRAPVKVEENVMLIARSEQGWRASVEAYLSSEGEPLEFVFFEIPAALRDLIEPGDLPYSISNSVSMSRATLCVIPKPAVEGKTRVTFDFRLPTVGSSQSISIPDIQLLTADPSRPVLALPVRIDNQVVRWSRVGRRLHDDWMKHASKKFEPGEFVFYQLGENQLQTSWTPATLESKRPNILFAFASIAEQLDRSFVGVIDYWVEPKNLLEVVAHLPTECELVGIQAGGSGAVWRTSAENEPPQDRQLNSSGEPAELRILMQPNYLPVHLRFFVRWQTKPESVRGQPLDLRIPTLEASGLTQLNVALSSQQQLSGVALSVEPGTERDIASLETRMGNSTSYPLLAVDIADRWKNLLLDSLPTVSDLKADEFGSWLKDWNPQVVGLRGDQPLRSPTEVTAGVEVRKYENVAEFWNWYLQQFDSGESEIISSLSTLESGLEEQSSERILNRFLELQSTDSGNHAISWYSMDVSVAIPGNRVKLSLLPVATNLYRMHQVTAAVLICFVGAVVFWLGWRLRSFVHELLGARPGIYWAFLAAIAWLVLPVAWPSIIIALSAASLFFSQFMSSRRRTYSGRVV